jgi:peptidoglycan/xylan/chitin deacetylase (PgdA/CDA1 family)
MFEYCLGGCIYDDSKSDDLKYAYDSGFQIASHTWSHKDLSTLSHDESEYSRRGPL